MDTDTFYLEGEEIRNSLIKTTEELEKTAIEVSHIAKVRYCILYSENLNMDKMDDFKNKYEKSMNDFVNIIIKHQELTKKNLELSTARTASEDKLSGPLIKINSSVFLPLLQTLYQLIKSFENYYIFMGETIEKQEKEYNELYEEEVELYKDIFNSLLLLLNEEQRTLVKNNLPLDKKYDKDTIYLLYPKESDFDEANSYGKEYFIQKEVKNETIDERIEEDFFDDELEEDFFDDDDDLDEKINSAANKPLDENEAVDEDKRIGNLKIIGTKDLKSIKSGDEFIIRIRPREIEESIEHYENYLRDTYAKYGFALDFENKPGSIIREPYPHERKPNAREIKLGEYLIISTEDGEVIYDGYDEYVEHETKKNIKRRKMSCEELIEYLEYCRKKAYFEKGDLKYESYDTLLKSFRELKDYSNRTKRISHDYYRIYISFNYEELAKNDYEFNLSEKEFDKLSILLDSINKNNIKLLGQMEITSIFHVENDKETEMSFESFQKEEVEEDVKEENDNKTNDTPEKNLSEKIEPQQEKATPKKEEVIATTPNELSALGEEKVETSTTDKEINPLEEEKVEEAESTNETTGLNEEPVDEKKFEIKIPEIIPLDSENIEKNDEKEEPQIKEANVIEQEDGFIEQPVEDLEPKKEEQPLVDFSSEQNDDVEEVEMPVQEVGFINPSAIPSSKIPEEEISNKLDEEESYTEEQQVQEQENSKEKDLEALVKELQERLKKYESSPMQSEKNVRTTVKSSLTTVSKEETSLMKYKIKIYQEIINRLFSSGKEINQVNFINALHELYTVQDINIDPKIEYDAETGDYLVTRNVGEDKESLTIRYKGFLQIAKTKFEKIKEEEEKYSARFSKPYFILNLRKRSPEKIDTDKAIIYTCFSESKISIKNKKIIISTYIIRQLANKKAKSKISYHLIKKGMETEHRLDFANMENENKDVEIPLNDVDITQPITITIYLDENQEIEIVLEPNEKEKTKSL